MCLRASPDTGHFVSAARTAVVISFSISLSSFLLHCSRLPAASSLAALALADKLHPAFLDRETGGQLSRRQLNGPHRGFFNIENRFARGTDQVMMRGHFRFEAQRAVMERDFPEDSGIQERLHVFVNGAQGNRWDPLSDLLV